MGASAICAALLAATVVTSKSLPAGARAEDSQDTTLRAQVVQVVDEKGNVVLELSGKDGAASLTMKRGGVQVFLGIASNGGSEEGLVSQLRMIKDDTVNVALDGPSRDPRLTLTSTSGKDATKHETKIYTGTIWLTDGPDRARYAPVRSKESKEESKGSGGS